MRVEVSPRVSRSLSSGAHSRDPLARPGYAWRHRKKILDCFAQPVVGPRIRERLYRMISIM